jgi:hypothetical protein
MPEVEQISFRLVSVRCNLSTLHQSKWHFKRAPCELGGGASDWDAYIKFDSLVVVAWIYLNITEDNLFIFVVLYLSEPIKLVSNC